MGYVENQKTINEWQLATFGPPELSNPARVSVRANKEMSELLTECVATYAHPDKIVEEAADVYIVLLRLAAVVGRDLHEAVDKKMGVNRNEREWTVDPVTGAHVRIRKHTVDHVTGQMVPA